MLDSPVRNGSGDRTNRWLGRETDSIKIKRDDPSYASPIADVRCLHVAEIGSAPH